ncbi:MAG: cell division protein FtsA [Verrucomicrobiota bacterium]|nr:cell division protein FtsA [Verrucomicrobiota bacterium]
MAQSKIIAAVEMGSSKIVVLVGEAIEGRTVNILGMGEHPTNGIKKGEITDLKTASACTHTALLKAERSAGTTIEGVYLAATGSHLEGFSNRGIANVSASDNFVTRADITRAVENAKSKALPPGRVYVHHIRSGFTLDGRPVDDPTTMAGETLETSYWHVHGDEMKISNALRVINGFSLNVDDMILSSIASGRMVCTEEDRKAGVLVIDIGAGTTDYALYKNGNAIRTGVIAVGGDHLTNDLSLGLRINAKSAESIKLRYGKAEIDKDDKNDNVLLLGDLSIGDRPIPRLAIYKILHARIDELLIIIKNKLGSMASPQHVPAGVVLTGGTARLPNIVDAAERIIGLPARLGELDSAVNNRDLRQHEYATALGLLYYGAHAQRPRDERREAGILSKLTTFLKFN